MDHEPLTAAAATHGACDACTLRAELHGLGITRKDQAPCHVCGGSGQLPLSTAVIVRRAMQEARRCYWPMMAPNQIARLPLQPER